MMLLATAVLGRLLTPEDYGLIGMVAIVTGFIAMFKDLGLAAPTIQREDLTERQVGVSVEGLTGSVVRDVSFQMHDGEIVGLTGYYGMLARVMNVGRTAVPGEVEIPLAPLPG